MAASLRVAHISDLHLLELDLDERTWSERARLRYLSLLRKIDPQARVRRLRVALAQARSSGFDHLFITGDLTEDGKASQFELLGEVLADSKIRAGSLTLVAGNHDFYDTETAWVDALNGPLAPFVNESSKPFFLGSCMVLPLITAQYQHWAFSHGRLGDLTSVRGHLRRAAREASALLVAQHHPPLANRFAPAQWVDGLHDCQHLLEELGNHPAPAVLHGHLHRRTERQARPPSRVRAFGAPAVCSSDEQNVRFYSLGAGGVQVVETS